MEPPSANQAGRPPPKGREAGPGETKWGGRHSGADPEPIGDMSYHFLVLFSLLVRDLWALWASRQRLLKEVREEQGVLIREPLFPLLLAVRGGWFIGAALETVWNRPLFNTWLVLAMLLVWGAVLALKFWVYLSLGPNWNVVLIQRPKQQIVTGGPYGYLRHPCYAAVLLETLAVSLMIGAYWSALAGLAATALALWPRILAEEAYLMQFPPYAEALGGKKRIIPWLL